MALPTDPDTPCARAATHAIRPYLHLRYPGDGGAVDGGGDRRHASHARYFRGFRERIAVTLQRSNAAVIRGHVHTCVPAG